MENIEHIIHLPRRSKKERELVEKYQDSIRSSEYAISSNTHVLYCAAERISIAYTEYQAYIYLDERRQAEEKQTFLPPVSI